MTFQCAARSIGLAAEIESVGNGEEAIDFFLGKFRQLTSSLNY